MSRIVRSGLLKNLRRRPCTPEATQQTIGQIGEALDDIERAPIVLFDGAIPPGALALYNERTAANPDIGAAAVHFALALGMDAENFVAPAAGNKWVGWLRGRRCADENGNHPEVDPVWFRIHGRDGYEVEVPAGSVLAYTISSQGTRVVASGYDKRSIGSGLDATYSHNGSTVGQEPELNFIDTDSIEWTVTHNGGANRVDIEADAILPPSTEPTYPLTLYFKADHQWSLNGYVEGKLLTGRGGATTGGTVRAYFSPAHFTEPSLPNVIKGQEIQVAYDSDGELAVTDPKAYGPTLGSVDWQTRDPQAGGYLILEGGTIDLDGATGGTFTLTYDGQTTGAIAYDALAATVQTALEGLGNIGAGNISVSGSPGEWGYAFQGALNPMQPPLVIDGTNLTDPGDDYGVTGLNLSGWGPMNGVWNSALTYNGSGIEWETDGSGGSAHPELGPVYLVPRMDTPGNILKPVGTGLLAHDHTLSIDLAAVTVGDHDFQHIHKTAVTCGTPTLDSGASFFNVVSWEHTHGDNRYSGPPLEYNVGGGHAEGDHTAKTTLSHSVSDHSHTGDTTSVYQRVHYKTLIPLERVDNSYEKLGV